MYGKLIKYFKRKLVTYAFPRRGEWRTDLTEIDEAFIYYCMKNSIDILSRGFYTNSMARHVFDNYNSSNPYDFDNYNYALHKKNPYYSEYIARCLASKVSPGNYDPLISFLQKFPYNDTFSSYIIDSAKEVLSNIRVIEYEFNYARVKNLLAIMRGSEFVNNYDFPDELARTLRNFYSLNRSMKGYYEERLRNLRGREMRREEARRQEERERIRRQNIIRDRIRDRGIRLEVLGLTSREDSVDLIKAAYRKLARECHPDVGGTGERFIEITTAYKYLTDNNIDYEI